MFWTEPNQTDQIDSLNFFELILAGLSLAMAAKHIGIGWLNLSQTLELIWDPDQTRPDPDPDQTGTY